MSPSATPEQHRASVAIPRFRPKCQGKTELKPQAVGCVQRDLGKARGWWWWSSIGWWWWNICTFHHTALYLELFFFFWHVDPRTSSTFPNSWALCPNGAFQHWRRARTLMHLIGSCEVVRLGTGQVKRATWSFFGKEVRICFCLTVCVCVCVCLCCSLPPGYRMYH